MTDEALDLEEAWGDVRGLRAPPCLYVVNFVESNLSQSSIWELTVHDERADFWQVSAKRFVELPFHSIYEVDRTKCPNITAEPMLVSKKNPDIFALFDDAIRRFNALAQAYVERQAQRRNVLRRDREAIDQQLKEVVSNLDMSTHIMLPVGTAPTEPKKFPIDAHDGCHDPPVSRNSNYDDLNYDDLVS